MDRQKCKREPVTLLDDGKWRCVCQFPRCGHEWVSMTDEIPPRCAGCKQAGWQRGPRKARVA